MSEEVPVLDYADPLDFEHAFDAPASDAPQTEKNSTGDRKSRRRDRNQARKAQPDHVSNAEHATDSVEITPETDAIVKPQDEDRSIDTAVHSGAPSSGSPGHSPLLMWAIDTYEAVSPAIPPITKAVKTSPLGVPKTLVIAGGLLLGAGVLLTINERNKQR